MKRLVLAAFCLFIVCAFTGCHRQTEPKDRVTAGTAFISAGTGKNTVLELLCTGVGDKEDTKEMLLRAEGEDLQQALEAISGLEPGIFYRHLDALVLDYGALKELPQILSALYGAGVPGSAGVFAMPHSMSAEAVGELQGHSGISSQLRELTERQESEATLFLLCRALAAEMSFSIDTVLPQQVGFGQDNGAEMRIKIVGTVNIAPPIS